MMMNSLSFCALSVCHMEWLTITATRTFLSASYMFGTKPYDVFVCLLFCFSRSSSETDREQKLILTAPRNMEQLPL